MKPFVRLSLQAAITLALVSPLAHGGAFGDLLDGIRQITGTVRDTKDAVDDVKGILPSTEQGKPTGNSADAKAPRAVENSAELPLILASTVEVENRMDKNFDEYTLLLSRPLVGADAPVKATRTEHLEGMVIRARFKHAQTESSLKIWRDYQSTLSQRGFKTLFICDKPCAEEASLWHDVMGLNIRYATDRYLVARKDNQTIAVALGELSDRVYSAVDFIEVSAADPAPTASAAGK